MGYVRLATFNSNTTAAAQEAFYDLQKQGVAGLVLDIRNNGGGLFPAGEFLTTNRDDNVPLGTCCPVPCTCTGFALLDLLCLTAVKWTNSSQSLLLLPAWLKAPTANTNPHSGMRCSCCIVVLY